MAEKSPIEEVREKLSGIVKEFRTSLDPLEKTIKTVKGQSDTLSTGISDLTTSVTNLSQDVGKLEDIIKSNKDLSTKVEELTKKDGTIYKLEQEIRDIKGLIDGHNPDTGLFKEINDHFTDLMGS